jgi:hypothetical protein
MTKMKRIALTITLVTALQMMLLLLGYSREQIASNHRGLLPEDGGDYEFKMSLLTGQGDNGEDYSRFEDLMRRVRRLPDFSRGDDAARRQLDALVPGWSSPTNTSRLAEALRCAVERLAPGQRMPASCRDRM